jgi:putative inorganic carbon (hco3(-)) transporter
VPTTVSRFGESGRGKASTVTSGSSFAARVNLWRTNAPALKQNPVIGRGLTGIASSDKGARVHSDFLRAAVETGIFGLAAFVWMLVAAVVGAYRSYRSTRAGGDRLVSSIALGAFAASLIFLLMSGDSNLMTQVAVTGSAWAVFALGHAAGRFGAAPKPAPRLASADPAFAW